MLKYSDLKAKEKAFVPGAGTYNFEHSYDKISKGTGRSWKWVNDHVNAL